jgi:hypothetical protein
MKLLIYLFAICLFSMCSEVSNSNKKEERLSYSTKYYKKFDFFDFKPIDEVYFDKTSLDLNMYYQIEFNENWEMLNFITPKPVSINYSFVKNKYGDLIGVQNEKGYSNKRGAENDQVGATGTKVINYLIGNDNVLYHLRSIKRYFGTFEDTLIMVESLTKFYKNGNEEIYSPVGYMFIKNKDSLNSIEIEKSIKLNKYLIEFSAQKRIDFEHNILHYLIKNSEEKCFLLKNNKFDMHNWIIHRDFAYELINCNDPNSR